jgi:lysozyme family protein
MPETRRIALLTTSQPFVLVYAPTGSEKPSRPSTWTRFLSLCRQIFWPSSNGYRSIPVSAVDEMIESLLKREGGYVDHPNDRGGPTRYGITQQTARAFGYIGDMRLLPKDKATEIYRKQYWVDPGFYDVSLKYRRLGERLFDVGVNMGPKVAGRFLQRALNGLNRGASGYPDMSEDGQIGQLTIGALDAYKRQRGEAGEMVLLKAVNGQQAVRYLEICESDHTQEAFLYGWLANRCELAA